MLSKSKSDGFSPAIHLIIIVFLLIPLTYTPLKAQIAVGQWREHLPYNNVIAVAEDGNDRIYCATPFSLFYYSRTDQNITKLNRINKLSDLGVSAIAYDQTTDILVIGYENGNLDLLKNDLISNLADIKRKQIVGSKKINHILIHDGKAFLSTDFGIVVLNLKRKEIEDTYLIGNNGSTLAVNQSIIHNDSIIAATISGIKAAPLTGYNLADFTSWQKIINIPSSNSDFDCMAVYRNQLIVAKKGIAYATDTLFIRKNNQWDYLFPHLHGPITSIRSFGDSLLIGSFFGISIYYNNLIDSFDVFDYNQSGQGVIMPQPNDLIVDKDQNIWIADRVNGLVFNPRAWFFQFIIPSGPFSEFSWDLSVENSHLWVATGGYQSTGTNSYLRKGFYRFSEEEWTSWTAANTDFLDTIDDIVAVAVNPNNPQEVWLGTWGQGLLRFKDGNYVGAYNSTNTTIGEAVNRPGFIGISGLTYDLDGNLWVAVAANPNTFNRRSPDGKWKSFNMSPYVNEDVTGEIVIDQLNQKWLVLQRGKGLLVFNDNNTPDNTADDRKKLLTGAPGNGGLPSSTIYAIACDHDGEMWVGTSAGIAVFYSPELIFSGQEFDAQQIYYEQEGISQYLLESENVSSIAIDGANRKWLGTRNSGVFLMSEDGTKQIHHFNMDNSPLLSNNILSIAIDHQTGEVYFATEKGIISYRSDATAGAETHSDVKVFPNPVTPEYNGSITVSGLVEEAQVRITDIAGNAVFEGESNGGTILWNGKNYNGDRVSTGVYLIFSTNKDGSDTFVDKILFVK